MSSMPGHRAGRVEARAPPPASPAARDRDHHHAGGPSARARASPRAPQRAAQDHLLEGHAGPEGGGCAEHRPPMDRAAISITTGAAAPPAPREPQLGSGPRRRAGRGRGRPERPLGHLGLGGRGEARRGHVDRLLEEGPVERIRLVEEGQGAERAVLEQAPRARPRSPARSPPPGCVSVALAQRGHVGRAQDGRGCARRRRRTPSRRRPGSLPGWPRAPSGLSTQG